MSSEGPPRRNHPLRYTRAIVAESADELLALLTSVRQGMTAGEVAAHFGWPLEKARNALEQLFSAGTLRKRSSRYRLKPH